MAWTDSRVFTQAIKNPLMQHVNPGSLTSPAGYSDLVATDVVNAALFNASVTPDKDAAVTSTGFNTGTWVTANEVIDTGGSNWASGGRALASKVFASATGIVNFDAADLAGAGNVTIAAANGCLVYDSSITSGTVAKQGLCFNYFGGAQSVTAGTFTVVWDVTGVFKFTN